MTVTRRMTIKPEEIIGVHYTCKGCGVEQSIPLSQSPFVIYCPNPKCNKQWLCKEYTAESPEPYNSTVQGFAAMLKRLPGTVIEGAVDFALEIKTIEPTPPAR